MHKCQTQRVSLPTVECSDEREERCFKLTKLEDTMVAVERCTTSLAQPRCTDVTLQLPAQTCVEQLKDYHSYGSAY